MGGVGPDGVVIVAPVLDDHAGRQQRVDAPRVEQFIAEPAIKAATSKQWIMRPCSIRISCVSARLDPSAWRVFAPLGNGNTYPQVYDALGRFVFAGVTIDF